MSDIVAIFWDFEYFHHALLLEKHGQYGMKKVTGRLQPKAVNVEAVMDFARSFGQVITNEAYSNWHWMGRYASNLELERTTLVQVFPEDHRQPADVYPAAFARVKEFMELHVDVNTLILVGFNNDYLQLADDMKLLGCKVIAVGAQELNDDAWRESVDEYISYYDIPNVGPAPVAGGNFSARAGDLPRHYLRVAAQQGVRMPPPKVMWIGIDIYASFLTDFGQFNSFKDLDDECYEQLRQDIPGVTMTEVKKIRQVLFKCYLFRPSEDGLISFQEDIKTLADIEDCYFGLMLKRIANNLNGPTDYVALSKALTGEEASAERLEKMHAEIKAAPEE